MNEVVRPILLQRIFGLLLATALGTLAVPEAKADLGVMLADPTTVGVSHWTHAGHSLVYLSGVCMATPVRARLCEPGEQGSIVTMYPNFYEDQSYSWNLVPLSLYLEGSLTPGTRLLYGSHAVKSALETHARTAVLEPVCGEGHCLDRPHSYWRDVVAATVDRDIFIYAVHTTRAQDEAVVEWLNSSPNVNSYRTVTNNCSDFTRKLVDAVFPHSVHRDVLNDLGMMSPKAAARSFTKWAVRRPELGFYSMHFAQQPGSMPRSDLARSGTEDGIHMKKYLIPAALIGDHEVAGSFFVAYFLTGRFGLYKEYTHYPAPSVVPAKAEAKASKEAGDTTRYASLVDSVEREQTGTVGSKEQWSAYREDLAKMEAEPEISSLLPGPKQDFPAWFGNGRVTVDADGSAWLHQSTGRQVGLSSENIFAPGSDPELAFQLMLGRVRYALAAKDRFRETMPLLRRDWALLERAHDRLQATQPPAGLPALAATP